MTLAKPVAVTVTLPAETKAYLATRAAAGFRSLSRELAMRIEESCARDLERSARSDKQKGQQQ